ncbi:MAG: SDR family NAD(P)-dependent oxidoreductase [Actinobacteria bacterium]|nr:SDR family NAD(P)-dependent oxidoreductase [Actinomycetota bacterium]
MTERAAIVTGASSGIGLAVARMLAQEGHAVTLVARRPAGLEAAYEALRADGLQVQRIAADVASEDDVVRAVAAVLPPNANVVPGQTQAREDAAETNEFSMTGPVGGASTVALPVPATAAPQAPVPSVSA